MVLEEICSWMSSGDFLEGFLGGSIGDMFGDYFGAAHRLIDRDDKFVVFKDV